MRVPLNGALPVRDYRAVFFDAGGTLLRPHPSQEEVTGAALADAGVAVGADALARAVARANGELFALHGRTPLRWTNEAEVRALWMEYYRSLFGHLAIAADDRVGARVYERFARAESWALYDDVLPTLRELVMRSFVLGVVSDWGTSLVPILHAIGLSPLLRFAVVSAYAGAAKPDRDVFAYALVSAGVAASEAVHVGDLYVTDVLGARGAGVEPVLLDREGRLDLVDCPVIRSLAELPPLLDAARKPPAAFLR